MNQNETDTPTSIQDVCETLNEYMDDVDARLTALSVVHEQMHNSIKEITHNVLDLKQRLNILTQDIEIIKNETTHYEQLQQNIEEKYQEIHQHHENIMKNNKKLENEIRHEQWNMLFLLGLFFLTYFNSTYTSY